MARLALMITPVLASMFFASCQAKTPAVTVQKPAPEILSEITLQAPPVPEVAPVQIAQVKAPKGYGEPKQTLSLNCNGVASQGGMMLCRTAPNAVVKIGRSVTRSDAKGNVILGFDRDAAASMSVTVTANGKTITHKLPIAKRDYSVQRIDGLPPSQVSTFTPDDLKRIKAASARKRVAFSSNQEAIYFTDGFDYPVRDFIKTSPFGSQRILNGEMKKPHYGVDIAAPLGTPIYAPADGIVAMADEDLYFEGAMVVIDHGQGLNSLYLHVNSTSVKPGERVIRGQQIGTIGSKGRSTGPHLCWRLKWRKEHLDPELLTQWPGRE